MRPSARGCASAPAARPRQDHHGTVMFNSLGTWFRRQSVGRKLTTTALTTSGVTLIAACAVFATYDYVNPAVPPGPRRHDARRHRRHQQHRGADLQGRHGGGRDAARHGGQRAHPRRPAVHPRRHAARDLRAPGSPSSAGAAGRRRRGRASTRSPCSRGTACASCGRFCSISEIIGSIEVESDTTEVWTRLARFAAHRRGHAVRRASGLRSACRARRRG